MICWNSMIERSYTSNPTYLYRTIIEWIWKWYDFLLLFKEWELSIINIFTCSGTVVFCNIAILSCKFILLKKQFCWKYSDSVTSFWMHPLSSSRYFSILPKTRSTLKTSCLVMIDALLPPRTVRMHAYFLSTAPLPVTSVCHTFQSIASARVHSELPSRKEPKYLCQHKWCEVPDTKATYQQVS